MKNPVVIVPNWNGLDFLAECLDSLTNQTVAVQIVVVDNGSTDGSKELVKDNYPQVHIIELERNYGFTGGVNPGLAYAITEGAEYAVLLNNDAVADKGFVAALVAAAEAHPQAGIITSKILYPNGKKLDSTGEHYSSWGFPFPRGRDEADTGQYDDKQDIFGASGGASLYRLKMLSEIGLFDQEFFAYYEDVDLSFRAQLAGWKVWFEPAARVYHRIGGTSGKLGGFTRYHTTKNFYYLYAKNMPALLYWKYLPKFIMAAILLNGNSVKRGQFAPMFRAHARLLVSAPHIVRERWRIQHSRKVSAAYIDSILYHQMPPTQKALRRMRTKLSGIFKA